MRELAEDYIRDINAEGSEGPRQTSTVDGSWKKTCLLFIKDNLKPSPLKELSKGSVSHLVIS